MKTIKNTLTGIAIIAIAITITVNIPDFNKTKDNNTSALQVYKRSSDKLIGITPGKSAIGLAYSVRGSGGPDLIEGVISSVNTFYIPTMKLKAGLYKLFVGNTLLKEFYIR